MLSRHRTVGRAQRLGPFVLIASLALILQACDQPVAEAPRPRPVRVQSVSAGDVARVAVYPGEVVTRLEADLGFRAPGRIAERRVELGDTVTAGAVIAVLDPVDLDLAIDRARSSVVEANASLRQAEIDLSRIEPLLAKQFVSRAQYDRAKTQVDTARSRANQANTALRQATKDKGDGTLRAPSDGVVTAVMAEPGQVVGVGAPVVRLAPLNQHEVEVAIPETRIAGVSPGAAATVRLWATGEEDWPATVREVAAAADPASRTYRVRLTLDRSDARVRWGMSATVRFVTGTTRAIALPLDALFQDGERPAVWVLPAGADRVALRPVTIERFDETKVWVTAGLEQGEDVVVAGVHLLDDDMPVRRWDGNWP